MYMPCCTHSNVVSGMCDYNVCTVSITNDKALLDFIIANQLAYICHCCYVLSSGHYNFYYVLCMYAYLNIYFIIICVGPSSTMHGFYMW